MPRLTSFHSRECRLEDRDRWRPSHGRASRPWHLAQHLVAPQAGRMKTPAGPPREGNFRERHATRSGSSKTPTPATHAILRNEYWESHLLIAHDNPATRRRSRITFSERPQNVGKSTVGSLLPPVRHSLAYVTGTPRESGLDLAHAELAPHQSMLVATDSQAMGASPKKTPPSQPNKK